MFLPFICLFFRSPRYLLIIPLFFFPEILYKQLGPTLGLHNLDRDLSIQQQQVHRGGSNSERVRISDWFWIVRWILDSQIVILANRKPNSLSLGPFNLYIFSFIHRQRVINMIEYRWLNEFDRIMTTNLNNWTWPKLKAANLLKPTSLNFTSGVLLISVPDVFFL